MWHSEVARSLAGSCLLFCDLLGAVNVVGDVNVCSIKHAQQALQCVTLHRTMAGGSAASRGCATW